VLSLIRVEGDGENASFFYEACSPAIESLSGLRPDAMVGRRLEEVLPPTIADEVITRFRVCVREVKTVTYATSTILATGPRDLEGSATPVLHPVTGRVYRIVALARDVTERKRIEETLRQTQKREALGHLTSGVAHDVNNVLAVISNGYDTIEFASADPVVRDCVATGRTAVEQAAGLVRHLLAFARHNPAPTAIIDTAAALAEIANLCRHALDDATPLTLDVVGEPWAISVDRHLLQAALLNLVTNARDAMPDGGAITIAARNVPAAASSGEPSAAQGVDTVAISVRDSGSGMSPDLVRQAAEPFFTTKAAAAGAGLGLAMVDGFARQSNGQLRIDSAPGRGTVVTISLPRARDVALPSPPRGKARPIERDARDRTILVVDDNAAMLRSTGLLLRTFGYHVLTASDGDTAFDLATRHAELDLVMTDIAMRGGSGIVLAERLEALRPGLPVVFMTGFVSEEDATGGRPVLRKPVSMREMLATFDAAFAARDPGTPATDQ
jgi:PAS domain S-box-containing protein